MSSESAKPAEQQPEGKLSTQAERLARKGRRPMKPGPAPRSAPAPEPVARPQVLETQGRQFGAFCRAVVKPVYLDICGYELEQAVWEEWGISAARFAEFYQPAVMNHPAVAFVSATGMIATPVLLNLGAWLARRRQAADEKPPESGKPEQPRPAPPGGRPDSVGRAWLNLREKETPPGSPAG